MIPQLIRVFPRKTKASPNDKNAFFGPPPMFLGEINEIHISVAFTWDRSKAEWLAKQWEPIAPVKIGGPAYNKPGGNFIPGRYIREGYVITSRGCPNCCWFCSVWKREGRKIRELPITEGWNVLDDNLLACSFKHIMGVFKMLKRQTHKAEFTGGLEAARLKDWHVHALVELKPRQMFFAYDTSDDYEPLLIEKMLKAAGFTRHQMRCYVLIGYRGDTFEKAEQRLRQTLELGFFPMAMLYRDEIGVRDRQWMRFQKPWARPAAIYAMAKSMKSIKGD